MAVTSAVQVDLQCAAMAKKHWDQLSARVYQYERRWSISRWLPWPRDRGTRVEVFVFARAASMTGLVWVAYTFRSLTYPIAVIAALTLIDAVIIVTAHALVPKPPLKNLNLIAFLTLVPWFAALCAPIPNDFAPALTWHSAIATSWAAVTASAVIEGAKPQTYRASLLIALASTSSLYYVLVILVAAVAHATNSEGSNANTSADPQE
jgi:hypothetical protein